MWLLYIVKKRLRRYAMSGTKIKVGDSVITTKDWCKNYTQSNAIHGIVTRIEDGNKVWAIWHNSDGSLFSRSEELYTDLAFVRLDRSKRNLPSWW
jgi:hypothetical protein